MLQKSSLYTKTKAKKSFCFFGETLFWNVSSSEACKRKLQHCCSDYRRTKSEEVKTFIQKSSFCCSQMITQKQLLFLHQHWMHRQKGRWRPGTNHQKDLELRIYTPSSNTVNVFPAFFFLNSFFLNCILLLKGHFPPFPWAISFAPPLPDSSSSFCFALPSTVHRFSAKRKGEQLLSYHTWETEEEALK